MQRLLVQRGESLKRDKQTGDTKETSKPKVLEVSFGGLGNGGVSSVILEIALGLKGNFDFHCVVFNSKGAREKVFSQVGALHRLRCYSMKGQRHSLVELLVRPFRLFFGIVRLCCDYDFTVVHCHNGEDQWPCLLAAKFCKVPVRICHAHNMLAPDEGTLKRLYKRITWHLATLFATECIACTDGAGRDYFGRHCFMIVPNAVQLSKFDKFENCIDLSSVNFVNVGRFTKQKNQHFVIDVFGRVIETLPNAKLSVIGFGDKKNLDSLKEHVKKLGLTASVSFKDGRNVDMASELATCDVFLFPSQNEGFGIVMLEAQAMGLLCFASTAVPRETNVGLAEYLPLDLGVQGWAERILERLVALDGQSVAVDRDAISRFDREQVVSMYEQVYKQGLRGSADG